jgi:hypothetical protein
LQGPTGPAGSGGIQAATVGGQLSLNSLTYGDTNPSGPSVSVTVPASGMVVVTLSAELWAGVGGDGCMSVSSSGGSGNFSAADSRALCLAGGSQNAAVMAASRTMLLTGLSAGQHTFTAVFRKRRSAPFFNVTDPEIIVMPVS